MTRVAGDPKHDTRHETRDDTTQTRYVDADIVATSKVEPDKHGDRHVTCRHGDRHEVMASRVSPCRNGIGDAVGCVDTRAAMSPRGGDAVVEVVTP